MSVRANEINNVGFITVSGGNMPVDNYTNIYGQSANSGLSGGVSFQPVITVTANGHAVERSGDFGLWDTVSGVAVSPDKCSYGGSGTNQNYPNV